MMFASVWLQNDAFCKCLLDSVLRLCVTFLVALYAVFGWRLRRKRRSLIIKKHVIWEVK